MSSFEVPEIGKFRSLVDQIPFPRDRTLIEALYLTASREAELLTKTSPWDLINKSSKPYGLYLDYKIENFQVSPATDKKGAVIEKVLLITEAVAKRMKGNKKLKHDEELTPEQIAGYLPENMREGYLKNPASVDPLVVESFLGELSLKLIALPCSKVYEPWTEDLLKQISKTKTLSFKLTRQRVWQLYRTYLSPFLKPRNKRNKKNPLRHFRLTHLVSAYDFNAFDLTVYSGWTLNTSAGMFGIQTSPQAGQYIHLKWRDYFAKLLKPLAEIL